MTEETTLVILKPDCVRKHACGEVIRRIEHLGLRVANARFGVLPEDLIVAHYGHLQGEPFFDNLVAFMSSGPSMVIAFVGPQAIDSVRRALGATDCLKAETGTIRGDLGEKFDLTRSSMFNIAHASDSFVTAQLELQRFFSSASTWRVDP